MGVDLTVPEIVKEVNVLLHQAVDLKTTSRALIERVLGLDQLGATLHDPARARVSAALLVGGERIMRPLLRLDRDDLLKTLTNVTKNRILRA